MTLQGKENVLFRMPVSIGLFICTAVMTLVAALSMFFPVWIAFPLLVIIPIIIVYYSESKFFEKLKLIFLIAGRVFIILAALKTVNLKFWSLNTDIMWDIVLVFFAINIAGAAIKDMINKRLFNAMSGFALLSSLPLFSFTWINNSYFLIQPSTLIFWIIAYTIWYWNFSFMNYSHALSLFHVAVLASPLFFVLFTLNPGYWLIMISGSQTFAFSTQLCCKKGLEKYFDNKIYRRITGGVTSSNFQAILMISNFILIMISVYLQIQFL